MAVGDPEELDEELDLEPAADDAEDQVDAQETTPEDDPEPVVDATPANDQSETPAPQERQPSRRDNRIQALRNEVRERDARLAETNRRIDELIARQAQPATQRETAEQRAARFAIMTPQEQIAETLRESEARFEQRMQGFQVQTAETADRTAFQAKAAVDPLYAKWAPKVEGKLAELRTKGTNVEREVLLKFMIGEAALERRSSKEGKLETAGAQRRVASQRARPTNSGSDTQAVRRQTTSLERRLENTPI
jgi:hypothetical protein